MDIEAFKNSPAGKIIDMQKGYSVFQFRVPGNKWRKVTNKNVFLNIFSILIFMSLSGCATGPSIVKMYENNDNDRNQIAILRVDKTRGLSITGCDGKIIQRGAKYILLEPGRHTVNFMIVGQTLLEMYTITNKKYIDVEAGHTYILKSKGGGFFLVGDKWFPEVIDVTNDPKLNVSILPEENIRK